MRRKEKWRSQAENKLGYYVDKYFQNEPADFLVQSPYLPDKDCDARRLVHNYKSF